MSNNEKIAYLLDYLELKYKLITPSAMEHIFKELGIGQEIQSQEYPDLMRSLFGKENLNLKTWKDRAFLKNFLQGKENIFDVTDDIPKEERVNDKQSKKKLETQNNMEDFPDVSKKPKMKIEEKSEEKEYTEKPKKQMVIMEN